MAAKSIEAVSNYSNRYHTQRINRRLDDRDNVLKEAFAQLEEKDHSVFPTVESVKSITASATTLAAVESNADVDVCVCEGANFSTDVADYSIRIGGIAQSVKAGPTASSFTIVVDANLLNDAGSAFSSGDMVLCQVRIEDVLCTEFFITLT